MSWWRKNGPGEDSVSVNGWVKLQSIWRKASPTDEANSNASNNPWVIDGWLRIKSAWRHEGGGIWSRIFSSLNVPIPKIPLPTLYFKWPDTFETTDSPINGSKMFVTRGAWTEEPNEFRIRIQELEPYGTWTTIYDTTKTYTEYLESDDLDRFPSNANDSSRPTISKAKTLAGYKFRARVDATNVNNDTNFHITAAIMPRLDFYISSFIAYSETSNGATFSWDYAPYVNSGSINSSTDIYSQVITIYDELGDEVYSESIPAGTTYVILSNAALLPGTTYTAELWSIAYDGYVFETDQTFDFTSVDFTTTDAIPEIEVNPTLTLISGESACVGSVYRLSSGSWTNNPTGFRYYFDRQNFAGSNILTYPSTSTYTSSTYYDYTLANENAQGIDAYTIAANNNGEAQLYAYATSSIAGPIKLPRPTGVVATASGSTINITWSGHSSALRYRIYWASSSAYEPGAASSTFDEEKTTTSWSWNTSDPDKNGISPSQGSSYVFYVSQSVGGTIWSSWSSPSALVTVPSTPVNTSRPTLTLISGAANKVGSTYRLTSGSWQNNPTPTQFRYIFELNNISGTRFVYYPSSTGWTTDTYYDHTFTSSTSSSVSGVVVAYNGLSAESYATTSIGPIVYPTYYIQYNANGGTATRTSDTVNVGSSISLPSATKSNNIFWGWYDSLTGGSYVGGANSTYTPSSDITLYARWIPEEWTITWNGNGGTVNSNNQSTYSFPFDAGSTITAPYATRSGYVHSGWRYPSAGDILYTASPGGPFTPEVNNLTMYARWTVAVPQTPTWVSASTDRTDGIRLEWNAVSGATSYEIWWGSSAPSDSLSTPDFYPGNTTVYTDTDVYLTAGSSRTYYIRARNSSGASSWSSGITGTKAYVRYTVTWSANGGTGGGTTIENAGSAHTAPSPGTRSGYTFNGYYDRPSGDYMYGPIASGGLFTAPSTITMYARWSAAISNATAPTSVTATGGNGTVSVSWSGATNATKYRVWWSTSATGNGVDPASSYDAETTGTSTSFSLTNGTTFYFWVSASNTNNVWTPYSSSPRGQATPAAPPPSGTAPGTPSGLSNSYSSGPSWTGSWSASTGTAPITYYWTLYQSQSNGGSITATASGSTSGTSFTRSMSSANGLWAYFTVYASNQYGNSNPATSGWA